MKYRLGILQDALITPIEPIMRAAYWQYAHEPEVHERDPVAFFLAMSAVALLLGFLIGLSFGWVLWEI